MKKTKTMIMVLMLSAGMAQAAFVTIGNIGNTDDTTGYGGVAYEYKISDHEVTIAEMASSGAGDGNEGYWNDDSTTGSGRTAGTNSPAVKVTLYEAMKYCNWLTSGNVYAGAYVFGGGGSYETTDRGAALMTYGTIYALPTEDEWYKAAYYDAFGANGYSLYADGTDTAPAEGGDATGWNYNYIRSGLNYVRDTTQGAIEQNGTVNMMGNVWEWVEQTGFAWTRGGGYYSNENALDSSSRFQFFSPGIGYDSVGFRVAEITAPPLSGEIGVTGVSGSLSDGGSENFGNQAVGVGKVQTFTIRNDATGDATSLSDFGITKSGADAAAFMVGAISAGSLGNGQSTTFRVTFTPISATAHSAAIHISSNDADESPFDINLTGTGLANADSDPGSDAWETANGFSPTTDGDVATLDSDGDGSPDIMEIYQGTERYPVGGSSLADGFAVMALGEPEDGNGFSDVSVSNGVLKVRYRRSTTQTAVSAQGIWQPDLTDSAWLYSGESSSGTVVTVSETIVSNGVGFEVVESSSEIISGDSDTLFFTLELSPNE